MNRLLFTSLPHLIDGDGVLIHRFGKYDSLLQIGRWLWRRGYSEGNLVIPDVKYHEVFLMIRNLNYFKN